MPVSQTLPVPSATALAHSNRLLQRIRDAMTATDSSISFRDYMHKALYEPKLGYYVAGLSKFGASGDFVTAPEISALYSQCIANQCSQLLGRLDNGTILELGAGSGVMAADILLHLEHLGQLPKHYLILDVSPDLQQQQRLTLQKLAPHLLAHVQWIHALPNQPFNGIILANEVLDAMPVERFCITGDEIFTQHVSWQDEQLVLLNQPASHENQQYIHEHCLGTWADHYTHYRPATPYYSEFNPALPAWLNSLGDILQQGMVLLIDYGYECHDYYRPGRNQGTLLCHYKHRVHDDVLLWPGLQDITASVDFSAVGKAALNAGFALGGYTTQANFLFNTGLETLFNEKMAAQADNLHTLAQQVRLLTLPAEMGERFKVMALTKGFTSVGDTSTLPGFERADQSHRL